MSTKLLNLSLIFFRQEQATISLNGTANQAECDAYRMQQMIKYPARTVRRVKEFLGADPFDPMRIEIAAVSKKLRAII